MPKSAKNVIDIGGSHGYYSVRYCEHYPDIKADIFDWKEARNTAEETIKEFKMENRIRFVEGDILFDNPGNHYDVALLFNTIRAFSEDEANTALKKIYSCLKPGGILLVADQFCTSLKSDFSRINAQLIVLELMNGSKGRPYSSKEVSLMLSNSGFDKPKEILLPRTPGISILSTIKK